MRKPAETEYPIHELLRERWSPRAFADKALNEDQIGSLLEAARWAPSCFNEQPWHFIVACRDNPEEHERMLGGLAPKNRLWAHKAPLLLITVASTSFSHNGRKNRHARHDIGLAAAQLTMQAASMGLVVHQMAGIQPDVIRKAYGIPDGFEPVTAIAVGYPGDPDELDEQFEQMEKAPRERKPFKSFVFKGRWGAAD